MLFHPTTLYWGCRHVSSRALGTQQQDFYPATHLDECMGNASSPAAVGEQVMGFCHFTDPTVRAGHPG